MTPNTAGTATTYPPEIELALAYLARALEGVLDATAGLSETQWNFKPALDNWSIAEILEHIVMVQEVVLGPVRAQLATAPAAPGQDAKAVDAIIFNQFPDRTAKFKGPEPVQPTGRWPVAVALERLRDNSARLTEYLETTPGLRQHAVDSLPLKAVSKGVYEKMDGYQWVLAVAAHTERHTRQMLEVKAAPAFPAQ